MKILASTDCVTGGINEIQTMIEDFRKSPCAHFTHQFRVSHAESPMYLDFPKEKILEVLNQPDCEGLRIYFAAKNGDLTKGGILTLLAVGYESITLESPSVTIFSDLINRIDFELNNVICCAHNPPPPPPNTESGINFI